MRIAIYGYGNIARGVEAAILQNSDAELYGIFTRRPPESVRSVTGAPVYGASDIYSHKGRFDVLVVCGGSATDLSPEIVPPVIVSVAAAGAVAEAGARFQYR